MSDLSKLLDQSTRPAVVSDLSQLVDQTVSSQSGLTGMALKSAVAAARKADSRVIPKSVDRFLPEIISALTPYWENYDSENSSEPTGFGSYLASREADVTNDVLALGDRFASQGPAAVQKMYSSFRGKTGKIITPALPELGDMIERHAKQG